MRCALLVFLLPATLLAGEMKVKDTGFLHDYAVTRGFMRGRPIKAKPTPDDKAVLFLRSDAKSPKLSLFEFTIADRATRTLLTPEEVLKGAEEKLSPEEKAIRERMRISAAGFADFQLAPAGDGILLSLAGRLYIVSRKDKAVRELKTGRGPLLDPKFSPDMRYVSYVRDNDVHLYDLATDKELRLTTGGTEEVSNGLAEFVAQEEMDRFAGYWWAPDGKSVVLQQSDARKVEKWQVGDPFHPERPATPFFYPRPGKANVDVRLFSASVPDGKTTAIAWDRAKYPYLATVRWSKKSPLLVCVQTRDQRELVVLRIDPASKKGTQLVSETDPAWVNIHQATPRWLPSENGFLWLSERSGGPQLELRSATGELKRVLVSADRGYRSFVGLDEARGLVYFTASPDPTQEQLYRVSFKSGEVQPLTGDKGLHGAVLGETGNYLVVTSRLWDALAPAKFMPRSTVFEAAAFKRVGELPEVAESPPFTPETDIVQVGEKKWYAAVTMPRHRKPDAKYPVVVDVYGGPHHLHVSAARSRWLLNQWLADQGFVVVAIDNRGAPGRGRDWERSILDKFGFVPLDDQVAALKALGERFPPLDLGRVGISGWSFGGYMAALAVLKRPDVFKAGIAGAPVTDWRDYDTHYTERYLGIPPAADKVYEANSLLAFAKDLKRPLLLIHGTADDNVYFRHTLKLANALLRHGRDFELLPMPGFTHMVAEPAAWEQMQLRMLRFLEKNLGAAR
ncbi:MAG: DPP IV N-terminal domain-containing protein [Gemmataceae bacterium]